MKKQNTVMISVSTIAVALGPHGALQHVTVSKYAEYEGMLLLTLRPLYPKKKPEAQKSR